jgi:hypothetical protein
LLPVEGGNRIHDDAIFYAKFLSVDGVVVVFPEGICVGGILSGIGEFLDRSDYGLGLSKMGQEGYNGEGGEGVKFHFMEV